MLKRRIIAVGILLLGGVLAWALFASSTATPHGFLKKYPFRLGLDLSGGTHLLYVADVHALPSGQVTSSMASLREVIERRINLFGVSEPVVQVEHQSGAGDQAERLSIDLPGVTDIKEAIAMIGQTPFLEFRIQSSEPQKITVGKDGTAEASIGENFVPTELTGKYLSRASLEFNQTTGEPVVSLQFNSEGTKLFAALTKENLGKVVAIYLDGSPISAPVVREAITGGVAQISGNFSPQEARELVGRLNSGALPVPITLVSTETVGAILGAQAVTAGIHAAIIGFLLVALFLLVWYRLPGLIALAALALYVLITLILYKLIPVTLSAAGIAGFIISIGMAVDANILIFERAREERSKGKALSEALGTGFSRAWTSIRDANASSLIIAFILFWFGSSLIKGFALTFGLGVLVSLLSAITITKFFLSVLPTPKTSKFGKFLFSSGFAKNKGA